jgi:hypothetical protein
MLEILASEVVEVPVKKIVEILREVPVDGSKDVFEVGGGVQLFEPALHTGVEIALHSEAHFEPLGSELCPVVYQQHILIKLLWIHSDPGRVTIREWAVASEDHAGEPVLPSFHHIFLRVSVSVFAQGSVHVRVEKEAFHDQAGQEKRHHAARPTVPNEKIDEN